MKMLRRTVLTSLTTCMVVGAVVATPALAASAYQVDSAKLVARGAGVAVTVTVTCDPYTDWTGQPSTAVDVTMALRQSVRHGTITSGTADSGWLNICDSTPHKVSLLVLPSPDAMTKGSALATSTVTFNTFGGLPAPLNYTNVAHIW